MRHMHTAVGVVLFVSLLVPVSVDAAQRQRGQIRDRLEDIVIGGRIVAIGVKTYAMAAKIGAIASRTVAMPGTMAVCAIDWRTFATAAKIDATAWKIAATGGKTCAIVAKIGVTERDDLQLGNWELGNWGKRLRSERGATSTAPLRKDNWRLETGNWKLGYWKLETGERLD